MADLKLAPEPEAAWSTRDHPFRTSFIVICAIGDSDPGSRFQRMQIEDAVFSMMCRNDTDRSGLRSLIWSTVQTLMGRGQVLINRRTKPHRYELTDEGRAVLARGNALTNRFAKGEL